MYLYWLCVGLVESPNRKVVLYDIKEEQLGSASSFLSTMRDMGDTIGIALFTLIIGIFSQTSDSWVFSSQVTIMIITFVLFSSLALFYANKYYKVIYKFNLPELFDLGYLNRGLDSYEKIECFLYFFLYYV